MCVEEFHLFMGWSSSDPFATLRCYHRLPAGRRQCGKATRAFPRLFSFKYRKIGGRLFCRAPRREVLKIHDLCPACQQEQLWEMLMFSPRESHPGPEWSAPWADKPLPALPVPARHSARPDVDHAGRELDPRLVPAPLSVPGNGEKSSLPAAPPVPSKSLRRPAPPTRPARPTQREEVSESPFEYVMEPHRQSTLDVIRFGAATHPNTAPRRDPRGPQQSCH